MKYVKFGNQWGKLLNDNSDGEACLSLISLDITKPTPEGSIVIYAAFMGLFVSIDIGLRGK